MNTNLHHLLDTTTFERAWLERLFRRADEFLQQGYVHTLPSNIVATAFFEPSTRTRLSFTAAAYKLGANVLGFDSATSTSSAKGESLEDTVRMVGNYSDVIVMRHPEAGAAHRAAAVSSVPIINAGDGSNAHPTQTILDLFTIQQGIGRLDDFSIAMIGDIEHSRVVHSLQEALTLFNHVTVHLVDPRTQDYKTLLPQVDIALVTRVQQERYANAAEAEAFQKSYVISLEDVLSMKPEAKIISPLPRLSELPTTIDQQPQAYYFKQAGFGVPVRAAILEYALGVWQ
jgi:aspartate carbamoyltransferase catalytic subunit